MKKLFFVSITFLLFSVALCAQVSVNSDGTQPDPSAMFEVKSTTKGALVPRMTKAQIGAISNPANGLFVFCTDDNKFYAYLASAFTWKEILYGTGIIAPTCGSLTINHVAGVVAPVTKTVTYNTVRSIPGEYTKCWITSNLGADHQATAVNDATEASAGWYWQFNLKQGYKHDGTNRTPNTAWINPINESSNWVTANDPCTIELGSTWCIPTITEWYNVDETNGWVNWGGPWNSDLKLHAAGGLLYSDGSLFDRNLYGYYWGSTQYSENVQKGWYLDFGNNRCWMSNNHKAFAFPLRCLREN